MAGSKSNYLESAVLNYWLGKSFTTTGPANTVIRLYNSTINDAANAATDRCAGANYADQSLTNSSNTWRNSTSGGTKTNKTTITFTTSASTGWGTIQAFAILDTNSTTTGNVLYWGDLTVDQTISAGNVVRFTTGAIVISED